MKSGNIFLKGEKSCISRTCSIFQAKVSVTVTGKNWENIPAAQRYSIYSIRSMGYGVYALDTDTDFSICILSKVKTEYLRQ